MTTKKPADRRKTSYNTKKSMLTPPTLPRHPALHDSNIKTKIDKKNNIRERFWGNVTSAKRTTVFYGKIFVS